MISYYEETRRLFNATANGQLDEMKSAIESKADPNTKIDFSTSYRQLVFQHLHHDPNTKNSLLFAAVLSDSVEIIEYVINDLGVNDFSSLDGNGALAIEIAVLNNKFNAVKHLIEHYRTKSYFEPFQHRQANNPLKIYYPKLSSIAFLTKNMELLYYLLDHVDSTSAHDIAMRFLETGDLESCKLINGKYSISPHMYVQSYTYCWNELFKSDSIEIADYIYQYTNGDIFFHRNESMHRMALDQVITASLFKVAQHLIDVLFVDVDINFHDVLREIAKNPNSSIEFFEHVLQQHIANPNHVIIDTVHHAASHGHFRLMEHIIKQHSIKPSIIIVQSENLFHAVLKSKQCTCEVLNDVNDFGIDINEKNRCDETPLYYAVQFQQPFPILQHLISLGADQSLFTQHPHFLTILSRATDFRVQKFFIQNMSDEDRQSLIMLSIREINPTPLGTLQMYFRSSTTSITIQHFQTLFGCRTTPWSHATERNEQDNCLRIFNTLVVSYSPQTSEDKKQREQQIEEQHNILFKLVQSTWVNEDAITAWVSKCGIDVKSVRANRNQSLLHLIATHTHSIPIFDCIMRHYYHDDPSILNSFDSYQQTPLLTFTTQYNYESKPKIIAFIYHILNTYNNIDLSIFHRSTSIMHIAARINHPQLMLKLIQLKCDVNHREHDMRRSDAPTPLFIAVKHDNLPVTLLLLEHKANVYDTDDSGQFHILELIFNKPEFQSAQELILRNIKNERKKSNLPPYITTSIMGIILKSTTIPTDLKMTFFQSLIDMKARLLTRNGLNSTFLHDAIRQGEIDIAMKLIEAGCPINQRNDHGETPLSIAYERGDYNLFIRLIELKANVNIFVRSLNDEYDDDGGLVAPHRYEHTPLHSILCQTDCDDDTIINLCGHIITNGADVNTINVFQELPIITALKSPSIDVIYNVVPLLLEHNADCSIVDGDGDLPLHVAATRRLHHVFTEVLHKTPQHLIDQHNYNDMSPFHLAFNQDWYIHLRKLLNHGIDVTKTDRRGCNVLHQVLYIPIDEDDDDQDDDEDNSENNQNGIHENNNDGEADDQIDENNNNNNNNQEPGFFHDDDFEFDDDQQNEFEDNEEYDYDQEDQYLADVVDLIVESFIHFKLFENEVICNCHDLDQDGNDRDDVMNDGDSESDNGENEAEDQIDHVDDDENNNAVDGHMGE